jgi:hypothetical protein
MVQYIASSFFTTILYMSHTRFFLLAKYEQLKNKKANLNPLKRLDKPKIDFIFLEIPFHAC